MTRTPEAPEDIVLNKGGKRKMSRKRMTRRGRKRTMTRHLHSRRARRN